MCLYRESHEHLSRSGMLQIVWLHAQTGLELTGSKLLRFKVNMLAYCQCIRGTDVQRTCKHKHCSLLTVGQWLLGDMLVERDSSLK